MKKHLSNIQIMIKLLPKGHPTDSVVIYAFKNDSEDL